MNSDPDSYDRWHHEVHGKEAVNELLLEQWHRDALSLAGPVSQLSVLEVGCGAGDFSIHLAQLGALVTGTDFSPQAVKLGEGKKAAQDSSVEFKVADAMDLPFETRSFDLVVSCECLEHVPNPQKALDEMYRVLKPGGRLVLTTENYSNATVLYWIIAWIKRQPFDSGAGVQPIEHFFVFWRVIRMMQRAGFTLTKMSGASYCFFALPFVRRGLFTRRKIQSSLLAKLLHPFARHIGFCLKKDVQSSSSFGDKAP